MTLTAHKEKGIIRGAVHGRRAAISLPISSFKNRAVVSTHCERALNGVNDQNLALLRHRHGAVELELG